MLPDGYVRLSCLVLDDEPVYRMALTKILNSLGISQVSVSDDVDRAIDILCRSRVDFAITDWYMPNATGLDFLRAVRQLPSSPNPMLPVLMCTANSRTDGVELARDAGANGYLVKPVRGDRLARQIIDLVRCDRDFVVSPGYTGPDKRGGANWADQDRRRSVASRGDVLVVPPDNYLPSLVAGNRAALQTALRTREANLRRIAEFRGAVTANPFPIATTPEPPASSPP